MLANLAAYSKSILPLEVIFHGSDYRFSRHSRWIPAWLYLTESPTTHTLISNNCLKTATVSSDFTHAFHVGRSGSVCYIVMHNVTHTQRWAKIHQNVF